jgi:hypothetical protein
MDIATKNKCRIIDRTHSVLTYTLNGRKQYIVEKNPALSGPVRRHVFEIINIKGYAWDVLYNHFDNFFDGNMPASYERCIDQLSVD